MLFDHAQQLVSGLRQRGMSQISLINQFKIETCCGAKLNNGRQVKREHQSILDLAKGPRCPADNRTDAVDLTGTRLPGLKADKGYP
ncbi:hypothetical protein D3C78_1485260 [compost metagenome]